MVVISVLIFITLIDCDPFVFFSKAISQFTNVIAYYNPKEVSPPKRYHYMVYFGILSGTLRGFEHKGVLTLAVVPIF